MLLEPPEDAKVPDDTRFAPGVAQVSEGEARSVRRPPTGSVLSMVRA